MKTKYFRQYECKVWNVIEVYVLDYERIRSTEFPYRCVIVCVRVCDKG
jgi:hypothetical protein